MPVRALFVDRDGTINVEKGYVFRRDDFEYIPGALAALKMASDRKIQIFIVTNQAGIAKGLYSEDDFRQLTKSMLSEMAQCGIHVADVLYCPHHPEAVVPFYRKVCDCRKPGVGLLRQVIEREGFGVESLALIGDKNSDIEAGRALGIETYLVETGYGNEEKLTTNADFVVADLLAAVAQLLSRDAAKEKK